jgi:hypothetical protein
MDQICALRDVDIRIRRLANDVSKQDLLVARGIYGVVPTLFIHFLYSVAANNTSYQLYTEVAAIWSVAGSKLLQQ